MGIGIMTNIQGLMLLKAVASFRGGDESWAVQEPPPSPSLVVGFSPAEVDHEIRSRVYG